MTILHGTNGTVQIQDGAGTWSEPFQIADLHPMPKPQRKLSKSERQQLRCLTQKIHIATARLNLSKGAWNSMVRFLGLPEKYLEKPRTPLRKRKHGGRLQSFRDVRAKRKRRVVWYGS